MKTSNPATLAANVSGLPSGVTDRTAMRRAATIADLDAILQLEQLCFDIDDIESRDVHERRLLAFPSGCSVLEMDEQVVAYLTTELWNLSGSLTVELFDLWPESILNHRRDGSILYVSSIAVHPAFQGNGFGSHFFSQELQRILDHHPQIEQSLLIVAEDCVPARRLYERNGFSTHLHLQAFYGGRMVMARDGIVMLRPGHS